MFFEKVLLSREDGSCLSLGQDGLSSSSKQSLGPALVFAFSDSLHTCLFQPSSLGAAWSRVEKAQAREKPSRRHCSYGACLLSWVEI